MTRPYRLPLHRRVFTHALFQDIAVTLATWLLRLMSLTFRVTSHVHPDAKAYADGDKSGIFCFWHGRMILLPFYKPPGRKMFVLISHHRDGELIAKAVRHFAIDSIRGSSSRGVREATRLMGEVLDQGSNVSITPDGPRGPAYVAAKGSVYMAAQTGRPMIPVTFSASRAKRLRSWDGFMIPLPFSRIVIEVGAPIQASDTQDKTHIEASRLQLESTLNQLTHDADQRMQSL